VKLSLADIKIGKRHRKSAGNLDGLAASIELLGLLQPIVVSSEYRLIAGWRRLKAHKQLGRDAIEVRVAKNLTDAATLLRAERDENTCRESLAVSEAVAIGEAIEKIERPKAKAKQKEGQKKGGGDRRSEKAKRSGKTLPKAKRDETARTTVQAAEAANMSRPTYEKAKVVIESGDTELVAEMDRTGKVNGVFKKLKRQKAVEDIEAEMPPLPKGPFRVIVADPPWQYGARADDPTHRASNPYPSMTIDEIAALDVGAIAHKDCVLWLWVTNAHLPEVWRIVESWGFTYKTMLTWAKNKMGTGDWLRGKTEHCLMCVRGKPTIKLTNQTTLLDGKVRKHSQKPEEFYQFVESLCPGAKAELFSREKRKDWQGHGNEL